MGKEFPLMLLPYIDNSPVEEMPPPSPAVLLSLTELSVRTSGPLLRMPPPWQVAVLAVTRLMVTVREPVL
jgi:hypothetical protein